MADNMKNQMRPIARNLKPPQPPRFVQEPHVEPKIIATFKTNVLAFQAMKKIRISHYENGPFMFYVHIDSSDNDFQRLVGKMQKTELRRLKPRPISIGMACLALQDKKVCRVAIAKIPQHQTQDECFVNFVDFGYNRSVKIENLFYIPDDILSQFTFAMPFSLAGCKATELKVSDREINFYFRQLTENHLLALKCIQPDGPPICQYCELYLDDKVNVLDKLKQWNPYDNIKFGPQNRLEAKTAHDVKVSYVDSAQEFYVHLQKPEILHDYELTSDELFKVMSHSPIHRNPKPGSCCAVFLGGEFYRGLVLGASNKSNRTVQVKIIDFGIVEEIQEKHVHLLTEKFVEKSPQAYRAILNGFEGLEVSENISTQFDIFCGDGRGERKVFKMTICGMVKDSYVVELEDLSTNPPVNVNKMLLKNSRPLIETIQLENAKKRQKEARNFGEGADVPQTTAKNYDRDRTNSQRGRGNYVSKGQQRSIGAPDESNNHAQDSYRSQQSPRKHFAKSNREESSVAGTYYKSQKEASVWGSKESTPSEHHSVKSDWDQPKNIAREQSSTVSWNDNSEPTNGQKNQKGRNSKEAKQKTNGHVERKKISSDQKSGWVSTLLSINRAFVHYDEHVEGLERILDEMFAFYENKNSRPVLKDLQIGAECAVRSNDGNWYRSKVDAISGDKIKVFHREYGNSEIVHKSKLRVLDEKFAKMDDLAVTTYFAIKTSPESDDKSLHNELVKLFEDGAKEFNFKVVQKLNDGWILEPIDQSTNRNVFDELVKMKKAERISDKELQLILEVKQNERSKEPKKERKSPEKAKKIEKIDIQKSVARREATPETSLPAPVIEEKLPAASVIGISVKMTAVTSPSDFYISRVEDISSFSHLHNDVQIIASGAAQLTAFEEGTLCLAQQPFDQCWYRSKIIDSDETEQNLMVTVRCMDDGKTFSVDDKSFLKIMPAALERKKFFGIACSLPIKIERKCEEEATDLMMNIMENDLHVIFLNEVRDGCRNYVELFDVTTNFSDLLVQKKYAVRLEMIQAGKCYTSHINSLSSFYLQFETDQLKLDLIARYFEDASGKFEKVEPKPGDIVASLFPDDGSWYRTRVESVDDDGYTVSFMDYGNTCVVKEIGEIAETTIKELPAMSKLCCLSKPKGINQFSDAAEKKFVEICANGATILDIQSSPIRPGETAEVEVYLNGKNVVVELIPLCNPAEVDLDQTIESNASENLMSPNE